MKNVLITGGLGFVGTNLTGNILRDSKDVQVTLLDSLSGPGSEANYRYLKSNFGRKIRLLPADITNRPQVKDAFSFNPENPVDTVIHLAAVGSNWRALQNPKFAEEINVEGTKNVFDEAARRGVRTFYHQSTTEVYGDLQDSSGPFNESSPLSPNTPYSKSKAKAENYVRKEMDSSGMNVIIGRPSNIYGPRQHPDAFIASFIRRVLLDRPLVVFGDGMQTRQMLHVEDLCSAVKTLIEESIHGTYNIAGQETTTIANAAKEVLSIAGKEPEGNIQFVQERPLDDRSYFMTALPLTALGWKPDVPIKAGLRGTFEWYKANKTTDELKQEDMETLLMRQEALRRNKEGSTGQGILPLDFNPRRRK